MRITDVGNQLSTLSSCRRRHACYVRVAHEYIRMMLTALLPCPHTLAECVAAGRERLYTVPASLRLISVHRCQS